MTAAEYAFFRIMQDKGIHLIFLEPSSRHFKFNGTCYTPDFKTKNDRTYYEVCGTRQAYHANKHKYAMFRATYPTLTLKIVRPDGEELQAPHPPPRRSG